MAREKASSIFYCFNHPRYREINAMDLFLVLQAAKEAKALVQIESVTRPGGQVGEGLDFIQEYRNKMLKQLIPWEGVPTDLQWKKSSVILHHIDKVCFHTFFFLLFPFLLPSSGSGIVFFRPCGLWAAQYQSGMLSIVAAVTPGKPKQSA